MSRAKDFEEGIKEVLLKPMPACKKYQKKPTQKELYTRFKLEKRK